MPRLLSILCVALAVVSTLAPESRGAEKPNVLFIAVDDLNDWMGCLGGHPQTKTPHIDGLAARGLLFTNSHCAAPACNPSRASLMTGVRPFTSGVYLNAQDWRPAMPNALTLSMHLRDNGYEPVGCGKIYHGSFPHDASWDAYNKKTGDPKPTKQVLADPHSKAGSIIWGQLDAPDSAMDDYRQVDYAADFLAAEHDKPFFLACGIYKPHMPWQVPQQYYDMYPLDEIVLPTTKDDDLADVPEAGVKMARPEGDHATILKTDNWKHAVQGYLASTTFADAQVGRLLKALDASPYADNTIVILWGDHGWHLGEKHHWRKFSLWEEATRAPLMITAPGVTKPGTKTARSVDFMSIYPTLCELCGVDIPEHCEGPSLVPLLKDPNSAWDRPAITTHGRLNHAVRSERFRYVKYANGDEELYDHEADPNEWTNLAADAKFADAKAELAKWLPKENAPNAEGGGGNGNSKKGNAKKQAARE